MEPETKKVEDELKWRMSVEEMPHEGNVTSPVFRWIFGGEDCIVCDQLHAWPFHGFFVFKPRGEEIRLFCIEELLKKIDSWGWSKPPHIEEVFKDVIETKERSVKDLKEFKQVAEKLRQKWYKLIE